MLLCWLGILSRWSSALHAMPCPLGEPLTLILCSHSSPSLCVKGGLKTLITVRIFWNSLLGGWQASQTELMMFAWLFFFVKANTSRSCGETILQRCCYSPSRFLFLPSPFTSLPRPHHHHWLVYSSPFFLPMLLSIHFCLSRAPLSVCGPRWKSCHLTFCFGASPFSSRMEEKRKFFQWPEASWPFLSFFVF